MKTSFVVLCGLATFVVITACLALSPALALHHWVWMLSCCVLLALMVCARRIISRDFLMIVSVVLVSSCIALTRVSVLVTPLLQVIPVERIAVQAKVLGTERRDQEYRIRLRAEDGHACTTILATTYEALDLLYGDSIFLQGSVEPLEQESYGHYLRSQGVDCTMQQPRMRIVRRGSRWHPLRALEAARMHTEHAIVSLLPEPDASLIIGLLTGSRGMIPPGLQDAFRTSGLTHILAISGYNITMILLILSAVFCWVPLTWRILPCGIILVVFTLFVGASASVVRACIMGVLGLLAVTSGRQQTMRLSILWTLAFMTFWNPLQLWWDGGFQLSFLALAGLTEFSPLIEPWTKRVLPGKFGIEESVRTTLAAQVLTTPWILFAFGRISLIAPVSNLLVLPAVPFAMATGTLATVLGMVWQPLGQLGALAVLPCTGWITSTATVLSRIPGAGMEWQVGPWMIAACYGLIFVWKQRAQKR